ncbi:MAG TPA: VWA domain-containing protein [Vicinamibacterales bacterium]|nr:VWA domain-containing protein [Vicinamibacterales bacterium]
MRRRFRIVPVVAVSIAASVVVLAQQPQVFRAGTRAVLVDVAVKDGNKAILGLAAGDFVVTDNGVRQVIDDVSIGGVPVDVTLFLGTMNQAEVRQLAARNEDLRRIGTLLRRDDRVRLLTLENQVTDVTGWIRGDQAGRMTVRLGGIQSLYDACFVAMMHRPDPDRRHLVIAISDGVEQGSVLDSTRVRDVARRAEAVLHLVLVTPTQPLAQRFRTSDEGYATLRTTWFHVLADQRGVANLREAAELTGGDTREVRDGTSIVDTFQRAFDDFRQSYLLRYTMRGVDVGGWHDLRVEIPSRRGATIRARKGYFGG